MLKFAGWDGLIVEGRSDAPVWIDIRDESVEIKKAGWLWGLDSWETQKQIWHEMKGEGNWHDWWKPDQSQDGGNSTQRPAVLTIGPAGENLCRYAVLVHDAGNTFGQGGFGGVFGSKNLKAISLIGTGSVDVADPQFLLDAWVAMDPIEKTGKPAIRSWFWPQRERARPHGCTGCYHPCRVRYERYGNGAKRQAQLFPAMFNLPRAFENGRPQRGLR